MEMLFEKKIIRKEKSNTKYISKLEEKEEEEEEEEEEQ